MPSLTSGVRGKRLRFFFERDETDRLPEDAGGVRSTRRYTELAEVTAGRLDRRIELRRRERARFEQHDAQSARVAQLRLIEDVFAETFFLERHASLLEPANTELQFRQDERQRRRGQGRARAGR